MEEQLKQDLTTKYNLTNEQITALEGLGVKTSAHMGMLKEAELTAIDGLNLITARTIVADYAPKPAESVTNPAPVAPAAPINVTVTPAKDIDQLTAPELLNLLANEPTNNEALAALIEKPQYKTALAKTERVAVIDGNHLDVTATLAYWLYLTHGAAVGRFQDKRTVTMGRALGHLERILRHPLVAGETIYMGLDKFECNWSKVDLTVMEAVYWARTTNHVKFPVNVDPSDAYAELTTSPLPDRWKRIVEDYNDFLGNDGQAINLVVTEQEGKSVSDSSFRAPGYAKPERAPSF